MSDFVVNVVRARQHKFAFYSPFPFLLYPFLLFFPLSSHFFPLSSLFFLFFVSLSFPSFHLNFFKFLSARMSDFVVNVVRARQHKVAFYNPEHQNSQEMFSASLPLYLFFTTYILVCLSWFYFCQQNLPNSTFLLRRILRLYLYINIFVYTCYIIFIIFLSQEKYRNTTHTVETVFASSISFCAGLSFAYFGRRLYLRMRRVSKLNVSKKIGGIALMCTTLFFVRSCMTIMSYYLWKKPVPILIHNIIWFTLIELGPSIAILLLIGGTTSQYGRKNDESAKLLNSQICCGATIEQGIIRVEV
eukprot:Phypoly_transcript_11016.p1 GENE.Phypoly_transcript_11016~~Phypoly_transcript_11016.p1  ORF type:complete len:302 (-),score=14.46 Phypoly_transcript_11016:40-945(-)